MPPQITEAWASAYFQIIFALLVFLLSAPALIYELADEGVRQVAFGGKGKERFWGFVVLLLLLVSLSFVWILHPAGNADKRTPNLDWPAALVVTLIPLLALFSGLYFLRSIKRETLITRLQKRSDSIYRKYHPAKDYNGRANKALLELICLGQYGKPGQEKEVVLKALEKHVITVHSDHAGKYRGDELEQVIRGVSLIIAGGDKVGNDENFARALQILEQVRDGCFNRELPTSTDATLALKVITELGSLSVRESSEEMTLNFLNLAVQCKSNTVLEIGLAALANRQYRVVSMALRMLERLAEKKKSEQAEIERQIEKAAQAEQKEKLEEKRRSKQMERQSVMIDLLGLLAHLSAGGAATTKLAQSTLVRIETLLSAPLIEQLNAAFTHHYLTSRFDTADNISKLMATMIDQAA